MTEHISNIYFPTDKSELVSEHIFPIPPIYFRIEPQHIEYTFEGTSLCAVIPSVKINLELTLEGTSSLTCIGESAPVFSGSFTFEGASMITCVGTVTTPL